MANSKMVFSKRKNAQLLFNESHAIHNAYLIACVADWNNNIDSTPENSTSRKLIWTIDCAMKWCRFYTFQICLKHSRSNFGRFFLLSLSFVVFNLEKRSEMMINTAALFKNPMNNARISVIRHMIWKRPFDDLNFDWKKYVMSHDFKWKLINITNDEPN